MNTTPAKFDLQELEQRKNHLAKIAVTLKSEFFGNDKVIDLVISALSAWYIFPALILRPVIVNLWGLTGVGKTQLVRRLTQLLGFADRFVEVQMDGISSGGGSATIEGLLSNSSIEEGEQGILLLDEIQRYRTLNADGSEVKVERYQDVWMLLSDGKFAANSSTFRELEMLLAHQAWSEENEIIALEAKKEDDKVPDNTPKRKRLLYPYEARRFKKLLRMTQSVQEIMKMEASELLCLLNQMSEDKQNNQMDYSKLLIFISGNLDEAYNMAKSTSNCDTDADIFHMISQKISVMDIKSALEKRFKPEQISRFGNNHIIYPSLSRRSYQQLIAHTCNQYLTSMMDITGLKLTLSEDSLEVIYQNSVYPSQGTRPVFSSIHKIFSDGLVQIAFQVIQNRAASVDLQIEAGETSSLIGTDNLGNKYAIPLELDVYNRKAKATDDFRTIVAVHEAGHALVYALLFHKAPAEVKINTASFIGGFMMPSVNTDVELSAVPDILGTITTAYAGRCAEILVFGQDHVSMGAGSDIHRATSLASDYLREHGLGPIAGKEIEPLGGYVPGGLLPDIETNKAIDVLLCKQRDLATQLLEDHHSLFIRIVVALLEDRVLAPVEFAELLPELLLSESRHDNGYVRAWQEFQDTPAKATNSYLKAPERLRNLVNPVSLNSKTEE
jgi:cell division protease FtsH